jgi:hypothetical protein
MNAGFTLHPPSTFKINNTANCRDRSEDEDSRVAPSVLELRHMFKIHSIPRADDCDRHGDDRDEREHFQDFTRMIGRHAEIEVHAAIEGVSKCFGHF